jgi:preprotein translocase subunit SecG
MKILILVRTIHIAVALFLVVVVLLQTGKRGDLAGAFGGGGSQTAFGARGAATLLSRLTTWSAGIFMVTSLVLALMSSSGALQKGSVLDSVPASSQQTTPGQPTPSAPPTGQAPQAPAPAAPAPSGK